MIDRQIDFFLQEIMRLNMELSRAYGESPEQLEARIADLMNRYARLIPGEDGDAWAADTARKMAAIRQENGG